jgi:hypothetical protein
MYKSKIFIFLFLLALIAFVVGIYFGKVEEISAFLALVVGTIAIVNYSRSVKIKRLEWLLQLFHRYMDEKKFRRMRYIIVFRVQPEFDQLKDLMQQRADRKVDQPVENFEQSLIMDMDDYLNFFELISTLWAKDELELTVVTISLISNLQLVRSPLYISIQQITLALLLLEPLVIESLLRMVQLSCCLQALIDDKGQ